MTLRKCFLPTVAVITICTIMAASCSFSKTDYRKVLSEFTFMIEPVSILSSIDIGEENIFFPAVNDSEAGELYPGLIAWSQSDYLSIADTFHEFVWNDPTRDWNLNYLSVSSFCDQTGEGFQWASFSFIQEKELSGRNSAIEHQIDIYPQRRVIKAWEFAYSSRMSGTKLIETPTTFLTAEAVLAIAENNGGLEERIAIDNECEISVVLTPNSINNLEWKVLGTRALNCGQAVHC